MSKQNPLHIITPAGATTIERAIINVLNTITDDMYEKKVKQIEIDVADNKQEAKDDHNDNVDRIIAVNDMIIELCEE